MKKTCTSCKISKPLSDYHILKTTKDGKATQCKECINKKNREKYATNSKYKDRKRVQKKEYLKRNREYVYKYLLEHPCIDCGESDPVVLEFDHQSDKIDSISDMITKCGIEKLKQEIKKCEVRCANCHRRKTAKDFSYFTYRE